MSSSSRTRTRARMGPAVHRRCEALSDSNVVDAPALTSDAAVTPHPPAPASQRVDLFGERSCLSLIVAGSSTKTALGSVSAGGMGTPELEVTHVVLDKPIGSAGGVTASKNSERIKIGSHCSSTR